MSRQQDTINTIEDLQKIERKLQEEYGVKSPKEQIAALAKMEELAQIRLDLFNVLKMSYSHDIEDGGSDLENQIATLRIVEEQLQGAKSALAELGDQYINKMRMVEFSTYFSQKYKAYNGLFLLILKWVVIIGLLMYVSGLDFVPGEYASKENVNSVFLIIITGVSLYALYFILTKLYDLVTRDNMNFNEYDFELDFDIDKSVKQESKGKLGGSTFLSYDEKEFEKIAKDLNLGCVDSYCCADGTMYDSLKRKCMPVMKHMKDINNNAALTKGAFGKILTSVSTNSKNTNAEPFTNNVVNFATV